jgi:hypothetical protein
VLGTSNAIVADGAPAAGRGDAPPAPGRYRRTLLETLGIGAWARRCA